jgi:SAM-dependent methyltransferase
VTTRLIVPDELNRNAADVHVHGPENTGATLIGLVLQHLGLSDLSQCDVLDVGCGVRFAQAIINRDIPIKSYTGVDVHRPLIDYLRNHVVDPRFTFAYWDVRNARYNPGGAVLTPETRLPVEGNYDVIWLFSVFTHLDPSDASSMLAILRRRIRTGGGLFFSVFLDDAVNEFEDKSAGEPLAHPCYSPQYLTRLVRQNGWTISSVNPPSRENFIQHYLVCRPTIAD